MEKMDIGPGGLGNGKLTGIFISQCIHIVAVSRIIYLDPVTNGRHQMDIGDIIPFPVRMSLYHYPACTVDFRIDFRSGHPLYIRPVKKPPAVHPVYQIFITLKVIFDPEKHSKVSTFRGLQSSFVSAHIHIHPLFPGQKMRDGAVTGKEMIRNDHPRIPLFDHIRDIVFSMYPAAPGSFSCMKMCLVDILHYPILERSSELYSRNLWMPSLSREPWASLAWS